MLCAICAGFHAEKRHICLTIKATRTAQLNLSCILPVFDWKGLTVRNWQRPGSAAQPLEGIPKASAFCAFCDPFCDFLR